MGGNCLRKLSEASRDPGFSPAREVNSGSRFIRPANDEVDSEDDGAGGVGADSSI